MENPGFDPGASCLQSTRSSNWANPPIMLKNTILVYKLYLCYTNCVKFKHNSSIGAVGSASVLCTGGPGFEPLMEQNAFKFNALIHIFQHSRVIGLVVWFSLWVREVVGSIPTWPREMSCFILRHIVNSMTQPFYDDLRTTSIHNTYCSMVNQIIMHLFLVKIFLYETRLCLSSIIG